MTIVPCFPIFANCSLNSLFSFQISHNFICGNDSKAYHCLSQTSGHITTLLLSIDPLAAWEMVRIGIEWGVGSRALACKQTLLYLWRKASTCWLSFAAWNNVCKWMQAIKPLQRPFLQMHIKNDHIWLLDCNSFASVLAIWRWNEECYEIRLCEPFLFGWNSRPSNPCIWQQSISSRIIWMLFR